MDWNMIVTFFENYGWQFTLLATSGIFVLGLLKSTGMFKKVPKAGRKYLYFAISCVLSIIACTIYMFVENVFEWKKWAVLCVAIIAYTFAIYTVYENTGIRKLLEKILFTPVKNLLKKITQAIVSGSISEEKLKELAVQMGSEALTNLVEEAKKVEEQKAVEEAKEGVVEETIVAETVEATPQTQTVVVVEQAKKG